MALELKSCCFCIDLRTGSLIIGYSGLFANLFVLLFGIMGLIHISDESNKDEIEAETGTTVSLPIAVIGMAVIILNLLFLLIFFIGMYKYKPRCVKMYVIYNLINIIFSVIMFIHNMILRLGIAGAFSELFSILMNIYFVLVVRSYYLVMGTEPPRPNLYPDPPYRQPPMLSGNQGYQPNPNAPLQNINVPPTPSPTMNVSTNTSRTPSPRP